MKSINKLGECNVRIIGGQIMSRVTANVDKGDEVLRTIKVVIPKSPNHSSNFFSSSFR